MDVIAQAEAVAIDASPMSGLRGWSADARLGSYVADADGRVVVRGEELDRFELHIGDGTSWQGYLRAPGSFAPLPVGSALEPQTGVFTWTPGAGFVGTYDFVFVGCDGLQPVGRREVRILVGPRGAYTGTRVSIDSPRQHQDLGQSFAIAGCAAELDSHEGPGIGTIHVWAYPRTGGPPVFVGVAAQGYLRPDVAAVYGDDLLHSGYALTAKGLQPGIYDLAVFAWSTAKNAFAPAATVLVAIGR